MIKYHKKTWILLLGMFVAVFSFTFLTMRFKDNWTAQAANPWAFDAGYIISDWQMQNYNSMSEADIQNFLKSKNPCNDSDWGKYQWETSTYPSKSWHWENGHFVCMADELFGEGTVIGRGETAAHIIWQAAQDYRINPQVLIVMLEKEQGLVTDTYPNNVNYRSAMGYGCPDTAACDSKYYGLKNQVRWAANHFRTFLDGYGWTNYPVGNSYVQYNPNPACGGSVINIRNQSTSALYTYTPYQPNNSALAAGYGMGDACGAYGNRNFYLMFEDWFGGITRDSGYDALGEPREMELKQETARINPFTLGTVDVLESGMIRRYDSKTTLASGEMCLRTERSTILNYDECIKFSDLREVYEPFGEPRYMSVVGNSPRINAHTEQQFDVLEDGRTLKFVSKIYKKGQWYYRTQHMTDTKEDIVIAAEHVDEVKYVDFANPRYMKLARDVDLIEARSGRVIGSMKKGEVHKFSMKINNYDGTMYYRTEDDSRNGVDRMLVYDAIEEMPSYEPFGNPREMILTQNTDRINPYTGEYFDTLEKGRVLRYTTKIFINDQWYYRTEHMSNTNQDIVVPASAVDEVR